MKRPEKKRISKFYPEDGVDDAEKYGEDFGYNQACDEWEKWLPSEEEIRKLCLKNCAYDFEMRSVAKAISKRIREISYTSENEVREK